MVARKASIGSVPAARAPTAYETRMHEVCKSIPVGKVTTYGAMAKVLASAPRAVGQALRRNPFAPIVPCHRVISADLQLGGFSGSWGDETPNVLRKKGMLEEEGVTFDGTKVSRSCVLQADELATYVAAYSKPIVA